jgi:ribosomal protein L32E
MVPRPLRGLLGGKMTDYEYEEVNIHSFVDLLRLEMYESVFRMKGNWTKKKRLEIFEAINEGITNACDRAYAERRDVFDT